MNSKKLFSKLLAKSLLITSVGSCFGCSSVSSMEEMEKTPAVSQLTKEQYVHGSIFKYIVRRILDKMLLDWNGDYKDFSVTINDEFIENMLGYMTDKSSDKYKDLISNLRNHNELYPEYVPGACGFLEGTWKKYKDNLPEGKSLNKLLTSCIYDYRTKNFYDSELYKRVQTSILPGVLNKVRREIFHYEMGSLSCFLELKEKAIKYLESYSTTTEAQNEKTQRYLKFALFILNSKKGNEEIMKVFKMLIKVANK